MNRRHWLSTLCAAGAIIEDCMPARASLLAPSRVVSLDWGLAEMLLSLGVVPIGIANPPAFRQTFSFCHLPESVIDVGLIYEPNLELLVELEPDLILATPAHSRIVPTLQRIAPVDIQGRYAYTATPYAKAGGELLALAQRFGREARAQRVITQAKADVQQAREALRDWRDRASLIVGAFIDDVHLRVAGQHSLYGEMLGLLGLRNAWSSPRLFSIANLDMLAVLPRTVLATMDPLPAAARQLTQSGDPVWKAMSFSHPSHWVRLPQVAPNGAVGSAAFFARALAQALARTPALIAADTPLAVSEGMAVHAPAH